MVQYSIPPKTGNAGTEISGKNLTQNLVNARLKTTTERVGTMVKNKRDMRRAIRDMEDFSHRSYHGFWYDGKYILRHWETDIAWVYSDGGIAFFDTNYYSNTTSGFQGTIVRNALSDKGRAQLRELLGSNKLRGISLADGQIWDNY